MRVYFLTITTSLLLFASIACNNNTQSNNNHRNNKNTNSKESLVKANRYLVNQENTDINNYVKRHNLDVTETGSGLKYQITKSGIGSTVEEGKSITMEYKVKLITGDIIYTSDKDGPMTFIVGHGGVETGLEEAILNMKMGDEAIIIIPSHLGHGLLGDQKKIPQRSTIIYEISITNIN